MTSCELMVLLNTSDLATNASSIGPPYNEVHHTTTLQASVIGISAGLLSLITIIGNLMVMISFRLDKQLQTICNCFLLSLAVADLIVGAFSMPIFTVFIIQKQWTLGPAMCDAWLSVDYLASNASVLNLLVISFDRYFSVTRPLTYRAHRTIAKAAIVILSVWVVSAIIWLPWINVWPFIEGERKVPNRECYIQFIYSNKYMSIVTVMMAFFVPVTIMVGLYLRVWWETVKRQRKMELLQGGSQMYSPRLELRQSLATQLLVIPKELIEPQITSPLLTAKTHKLVPSSLANKKNNKAAKTLTAILLAFIVTWTPYSVLVVIKAALGKEAADQYVPFALWDFSYYLCYLNSTVNPFLYALCNPAFRRTYLRILTCRWGSNSARRRQVANSYSVRTCSTRLSTLPMKERSKFSEL